eukprot:2655392-Pleurochrysis_carterae.AAC.1
MTIRSSCSQQACSEQPICWCRQALATLDATWERISAGLESTGLSFEEAAAIVRQQEKGKITLTPEQVAQAAEVRVRPRKPHALRTVLFFGLLGHVPPRPLSTLARLPWLSPSRSR